MLTVLSAAAALTASMPAQASVCCMTAGIFGVGRLALWEGSAAGLRVTGADTLGTWSAEGRWSPNPAGYFDDELRVDSYGLLRLSERGQIFALVPTLVTRRGVGDDESTAGGLGDLELGVRYEAVLAGEHQWLPALGLTGALLLPSGVRPEEAKARFGTDATGRSALGAAGALSAERFFGPAFGRLDVGGTVFAPFVRSDLRQTQRYGPSLAASVSAGGTPVSGLLLGGVLGVVHDLPLVIGKAAVADSAATLGSAGAVVSWTPSAHWTLVASASSGLFLDDLGQNRPGRVTVSLGARYGQF